MEKFINCLNGDCLELMKTLPDKSIDLFVCDLPYGCITTNACSWDNKIDLDKFWTEVKRLCRNNKTPVLMFCTTRYGNELINSNPDWFRYDIVWNKNFGTNFLLCNKRPMQSHEMIYVFSKKVAFYKRIDHSVEGKQAYITKDIYRKSKCYGDGWNQTGAQQVDNTRCPLSVINFPMTRTKIHPTCKIIDLYKWLIERYSNEGDTVLDPTAGSFNSGRACQELNRNYIGIEMNKEYFDNNKL